MAEQTLRVTLADDQLDALAERIARRLTTVSATSSPTSEWLTTDEAARYLKVSTTTLHRLKAAGELPFHQDRQGCRLHFKRTELDAWRCC